MSNKTGTIFDIKEFAVHDGPGIRMTVFLKGCPLHCAWCHNPEGISPNPEVMTSPLGNRIVGWQISADELAERIMSQADILRESGGGVTFSGGEPAQQADFLEAVLEHLTGIHTLLDTSGHVHPSIFAKLIRRFNMLHYDLKLIDPTEHKKYCGVCNRVILENLEQLKKSEVPFVIRIPMVPGITDTIENITAIAKILKSPTNLLHIELLGYNKVAGGKYGLLGKEFIPQWDENATINYHQEIFSELGIKVKTL